jgi:tetratricopeptide (TPR) repeat protein
MTLKRFWICVFCVIGVFSFAAAQGDDGLDSNVQEALRFLEELESEKAQELLDEALARDSSYAPALYAYHHVELMYGNLSEAQAYVRKAIEYNPSEQSYREKFDELRDLINQVKDAQREVENRNYDSAKRIYNELLEKNPSIAELYYRLGFIAIQEENYDEARDYFDKSSILAPKVKKYTKAKNILAAKILQEAQESLGRGDLSTAERKAVTSLRINPEFGSAYSILGYIKLRNGDINAAIENMEKAVSYNPESQSAWYNLGSIYRRTRQYKKAEDALQRAIELNPQNAKAYTNLGQVYLAEDRLEEAENNLKMSITLDPNSPAAHESYGELLNSQERYKEAIEHLEKAVDLIPNPRNRYLTSYRLAHAYNRTGEYNKAKDLAQEVTSTNSRFGGGWYELGIAYAKLGDTKNAINAFNKGRLDSDWRSLIDPERERLLTGKGLSF